MIYDRLDAIGGMMSGAAHGLKRWRGQPWTATIEARLMPDLILTAKANGTLEELAKQTFEEARSLHPVNKEICEYMLDWIYLLGSYLIMRRESEPGVVDAVGDLMDIIRRFD